MADAALAVAIALYVQQDTWLNDWVAGWSLTGYAITGLAMTLPLALRRRRPVMVAAIVFGALVVQVLAVGSGALARVLQKLDLRDRVQAVIFAYENGLVTPGAAES